MIKFCNFGSPTLKIKRKLEANYLLLVLLDCRICRRFFRYRWTSSSISRIAVRHTVGSGTATRGHSAMVHGRALSIHPRWPWVINWWTRTIQERSPTTVDHVLSWRHASIHGPPTPFHGSSSSFHRTSSSFHGSSTSIHRRSASFHR